MVGSISPRISGFIPKFVDRRQGVLAYRTKMRDRDPTWHARGDDETLGIHWVLACWKKKENNYGKSSFLMGKSTIMINMGDMAMGQYL